MAPFFTIVQKLSPKSFPETGLKSYGFLTYDNLVFTPFIVVFIRLQPQGERLAITLVAGDFNRLMQWLTQLEQQYRVHIVALDVSAQENRPGGVNINSLVLEGKAGR